MISSQHSNSRSASHGPGGAEGKRRPSKEESILNAAREAFLSRGFGSTSMDSIASAAGVSKHTIYSYFDSKEALFKTMISNTCDNFNALVCSRVNQFLADPSRFHTEGVTPGFELLCILGEEYGSVCISGEGVNLERICIVECPQFPGLASIFFEYGVAKVLPHLEKIFAQIEERGYLRFYDIAEAAVQFPIILKEQGYMFTRLMLGMDTEISKAELALQIRRGVALFMRMYCVPEDQAE